MSVLGKVMCDSKRECVPGKVHRLDPDLELCVCGTCGKGWVRDRTAFDKLAEAIEKFNHQNAQLRAAADKLKDSLEKLNDVLRPRHEP
jgi:hypothetical protein